MRAPLLTAEHHWVCPNCTWTDVTHETEVHTRYHTCRPSGLLAPMIPVGTRAKVEVLEREDYVGRELVQTDRNGRPVMSVVTTRDDGTDCAVYAPTATTIRD